MNESTKSWRLIFTSLALLVGVAALSMTRPAFAENKMSSKSAYDFSFVDIDGELMGLEQYRGKVVVVVNTASQCGFTNQYDDLQALWENYGPRGLVVLGVPSNQFGGQEPGSNEDIKEFCSANFNIDFPMTEKTEVVGDNAHPFYKWATDELGARARPRWNFHKYIVGRDGRLLDYFVSTTNPSSSKFKKAIETALVEAN